MEIAEGVREKLEIFGDDYDTPDGTGVRDYIHVNDLASAHVSVLELLKKNDNDILINLATGKGYSVLDVVKKTEEITGRSIPYDIVDRRPGDPAKLIAVSKAASSLLGWEPKYSDLATLLKSMWSLYSKVN